MAWIVWFGGGLAFWNNGMRLIYPDGTPAEKLHQQRMRQKIEEILLNHEFSVEGFQETDPAYAKLPLKELLQIYEYLDHKSHPIQSKKLIRAIAERHKASVD